MLTYKKTTFQLMSSLTRNKYTVCATIIGLFLAYKLFIERKSSKDTKKKDTFTIVLLSDIHNSINNIKKVKAYIDKNRINVDGLFMPGDFLNLKGNDYKDPLKIKESKSDLKSLFHQGKMIFNKPVVLPGNVRFIYYVLICFIWIDMDRIYVEIARS